MSEDVNPWYSLITEPTARKNPGIKKDVYLYTAAFSKIYPPQFFAGKKKYAIKKNIAANA